MQIWQLFLAGQIRQKPVLDPLDIPIQIQPIQLLIITENFSPLPVFEPGTSPVQSRYATNWAILAWIYILHLYNE